MTPIEPRSAARIGAILPAAGSSRRMGKPKLLLPFGLDCVIDQTAAALHQGGAERIVIVTAPDDYKLRQWVSDGPWELAINPDPTRGMLSSIQEGLKHFDSPPKLETLLICPADLPLLRAATVARLIAERDRCDALLAVPIHEDRRGHPLAIAGGLIEEIYGLDPNIGLRQLLTEHGEDVLRIEIDDPGAYRDVDTPADYRRLLTLTADDRCP